VPAAQAPKKEEDEDRGRRGRKGRGRHDREDRVKRESEPRAEVKTDAPREEKPVEEKPREEKAPEATGAKLTRDEAFDLVRRAVQASSSNGKSSPATKVRTQARELLGRDSESLNERNFMRILHDAHDADVIDLRRRGGVYEVAPAVAAPSVDRQLEVAEKANTPVPKPQPPVIRGMAARGIGRGRLGAKAAPPANLLMMGVVASAKPAAPVAAPTNTAKAPDDNEAVAIVEASEVAEAKTKPTRGRKRSTAKKAPKAAAAKTPRAKKKTAAKAPAGAGSE
jgi:hypothetical protein